MLVLTELRGLGGDVHSGHVGLDWRFGFPEDSQLLVFWAFVNTLLKLFVMLFISPSQLQTIACEAPS